MKQDTIIADQSCVRLDKFLAEKLDNISRSQIQKLIRNGHILVNGEHSTTKYNVADNDEIQLNIPETDQNNEYIEPENIPLNIIHEDDDIIVINKPAGLTVHPGVGNYLSYSLPKVAYRESISRSGHWHSRDLWR